MGGEISPLFSFLLLWGAVYQCAEAPLVCQMCLLWWMNCIHLSIIYVCIYVCTWKPEIHINLTEISFSAGAFTPSSPISEMYA